MIDCLSFGIYDCSLIEELIDRLSRGQQSAMSKTDNIGVFLHLAISLFFLSVFSVMRRYRSYSYSIAIDVSDRVSERTLEPTWLI